MWRECKTLRNFFKKLDLQTYVVRNIFMLDIQGESLKVLQANISETVWDVKFSFSSDRLVYNLPLYTK